MVFGGDIKKITSLYLFISDCLNRTLVLEQKYEDNDKYKRENQVMDPIKFSGNENCCEDGLEEDDQHVYLLL